jgi:hypothetical protein
MSLSLKTLIDPQKVALARARFHAWWEGETFDRAAIAADKQEQPPPEATLPEPAAEPRLTALEILWGKGRVTPGEEHDDRLQPARIGLPATGLLAVLGPGLEAPILAAAEAHPGDFIAYEWREEAQGHLAYRLANGPVSTRAKAQAMDFDLFAAPAEAWDGAWSLDEFSFAPNPSRLALQLFKGLKPGTVAVVEAYVSDGRRPLGSAFASAFAEPQVMEAAELARVLTASGFGLDEEEDLTADHLRAGKEGFRRLEQALAAAAAQGLEAGVAREIAWEAESWAHRMAALSAAHLQRRRYVARKPE